MIVSKISAQLFHLYFSPVKFKFFVHFLPIMENQIANLTSCNADIKAAVKALEDRLFNLERASFEKPIIEKLLKENSKLEELIEQHCQRLRKLQETNTSVKCSNVPVKEVIKEVKAEIKDVEVKTEKAKKKEAKVKKPQEDKKETEAPVDVGRLDLKVGRIVEIKRHPDADSLYVEQVDIGKDSPITVVSGLVKFVPIEEMEKRLVIVLGNLKPVKMRGITSEAMVMCASTPEKVEVLCPPDGSVPGDVITVPGYERNPDPVLNPKKKIFETVAPDLKTDSDCVATYKGAKWSVAGKGLVTAPSLTNVNIK